MALSVRTLIVGLTVLGTSWSAPAEPPVTQLITFRVLSGSPLSQVHYRPDPRAAPRRLTLYSSAPSAVVQARVGAELVLTEDPAGETELVRLAVPAALAGPALILLRAHADGTPIQWQAGLLLREHQPRSGSMRVVNQTRRPVRVDLDGQRLELADGAHEAVRAHRRTTLRVSTLLQGRWRRVTEFEFEADPDSRGWLILWPPHRAGELQPRLQLFFDPAE